MTFQAWKKEITKFHDLYECCFFSLFTMQHKYNKCSHLLHKHKESDVRKRNELQNEAAGVWDNSRFQNGGRNSAAAIAPQTKKMMAMRTRMCKQERVLLVKSSEDLSWRQG